MIKNIIILALGLGIGGAVFYAAQGGNIDLSRLNLPKAPNLTQQNPSSVTQTKTVYKEESNIVNVVRKTNNSVVSIAVKRTTRPFQNRDNPLFEDFFGMQGPQMQRPPTEEGGTSNEDGIGTGFVLTQDGIILTNKHVIDAAGQYVVITNDNKKYDVTNITKDPFNDVAIIRTNGTGLTPVELGDSDALEVGQSVIAMGNALGEFSNSVTVGIVSGLNRDIVAGDARGASESLSGVIQTDAAINPGSSGGPLLNLGGQVVGINTAVADGSFAQNIGFAIPINKAKPVIDEYLRTGNIARPYLGVQYRMLTRQLATYYEVPEGAYVFEAVSGSPAAQAGLIEGDIITEIDGKQLNANNDLSQVVRTLSIGQTVDIKYYRNGNAATTRITVGEFKE